MNRDLKKIITAKKKFDKVVLDVELSLIDKVEFEFTIFDQSSDGIMLLDRQTSNNAMLKDCIQVIEEKGVLSMKDYLTLVM